MSDRVQHMLSVIYDNLSDTDRQSFSAAEKRVSHIRDMASVCADGIRQSSGMRSALTAILRTDNAHSEFAGLIPERTIDVKTAPCNSMTEKMQSREIMRDEMLIFCRELCRGDIVSLPELMECLVSAGNDNVVPERKIAILRNGQAGMAFEKFARNIFGVSAVYGDSFQSLCESVARSDVMYAVIPVENSSDGRLNGIHRIMEKYDLFTVMSCDITSADDVSTRFALVGKKFEYIEAADGIRTFEYRLTFGDIDRIADMITAARFYGAGVVGMSSIPGDYSGGKYTYAVTLDIGNADTAALLVYLKLNYLQFIPVGIYVHIGDGDRS